MKFFAKLCLTIGLVSFVSTSHLLAQSKIVVSGEANGAIPVALKGFSGEVLQVLQFDLTVQGFKVVSEDQAPYLISGSNSGNVQGNVMLSGGNVNLKGTPAGNTGGAKEYIMKPKAYSGGSTRRQAHAFADDVIEAISGRKGIGQTKIAFKVDTGANSEIYIADFDGHGAQEVTHDNTIVAAPTWVPGKLALYYTTYKLGNPDIYRHDLSSGQRSPVARYSGLNTSAAVSPNGSKVAMILSKGGSPDVYVCNADGSGLTQLTKTREDESSPCWSPDGQWICFAGKKDERRSLWKIPVTGGTPVRIATTGVSNPTEPDWSPDGKLIVFTSMGRYFSICTVPAEGGTATVVADGEDPSWAPNSRTVVYARRDGGARRLSLLDVPTKQTKDAARVSGGNSQPSWAK